MPQECHNGETPRAKGVGQMSAESLIVIKYLIVASSRQDEYPEVAQTIHANLRGL